MMTAEPPDRSQLISVIVPAYNAARTVGATIDSVLSQTHPVFEILVVDDGSQDETGEIVIKAANHDSRIRLLRQKNLGVAAARNLGIKHSRGEYIAPLDSDDRWLPQKLEKQIDAFRASPSTVGLVYAWSARTYDDGQPTIYPEAESLEESTFLQLVYRNVIGNASAPLIRRKCFDTVGLYDTSYVELDAQGCEDWDLYLRIAEHCEFRTISEHLIEYRQRSETMSADHDRMLRAYDILMSRIKARYPDIPPFVYKWSKGNFLFYLATKATRIGARGRALTLLFDAMTVDPILLNNSRFRRMVLKNLLGAARRSDYRTPGQHRENQNSNTGDSNGVVPQTRKQPLDVAWTKIKRKRLERLLDLEQSGGFQC